MPYEKPIPDISLIQNTNNDNTILSNNKSLIFHAVTIMSILILAIFTESNSLSSLSCLPLIWLYENILHAEFNQMSCFIIWNFKIAVASHYVITPVIVNFWRYVVNVEYANSHDLTLCTLSFRNTLKLQLCISQILLCIFCAAIINYSTYTWCMNSLFVWMITHRKKFKTPLQWNYMFTAMTKFC